MFIDYNKWLIDWLIDCLIDWLIDWLIDHSESRLKLDTLLDLCSVFVIKGFEKSWPIDYQIFYI